MKVTVDIPFALLSYVKFIPEDMMPEVLLQALEDKIKARSFPKLDAQDAKYDEILSILNRMQFQPLMPATTSVAESNTAHTDGERIVPQARKTTITFDTIDQDDSSRESTDGGDEDEFLFDDLMK